MKKKAKVLLVFPNINMYMNIPAGISILSACLKTAGHDVSLFDCTLYAEVNDSGDEWRAKTLQVKETDLSELEKEKKHNNMFLDFRKKVEEYKPDLIGVSCVEATLEMGYELLEEIKDVEIPKMIGGIVTLFLGEQILENNNVDMICVGEGEHAIVELANTLASGQDYSRIQNLWLRAEEGIIKNPIRPLVKLDELPMPDWTIFEKSRFFKPMGGTLRVTASIEDSRGCCRRCTYCCTKGQRDFYRPEKYLRKKSVTRVIQEIRYAKENYGVNYITFHSQNFFMDRKHDLNEFVEAYKEIALPFWLQTEPGSFTAENLRQFKEIGCEGISMGVEHGNEEFRKEVLKRHYSNEYIYESVKTAEESGIRVTVNNIIGFPTETRELIFDTIKFNKRFTNVSSMVNLFAPYIGTELRGLAEEKGYIEKGVLCGDFRKSYYLEQPQISAEELLGLQRTFALYVKFPYEKWDIIRKAEKFDEEGNMTYEQLVLELRNNT